MVSKTSKLQQLETYVGPVTTHCAAIHLCTALHDSNPNLRFLTLNLLS